MAAAYYADAGWIQYRRSCYRKMDTGMKNTIFMAAIAGAIAGCVSTGSLDNWEKQGTTAADFNTDASQCKAQGLASSAPMVLGNSVYSECMKGKGWRVKGVSK